MKTEIIAVGTELLLGQIVNTNAQWISRKLAQVGMPVYHQCVVGDNLQRVENVFRAAHKRSDVIIVTGGLGPTEDDLTREAAQPIFRQNLIEHPSTIEKIIRFYEKNDRRMTLNNRKQSLVFEQAIPLMNEEGMAPGQIVEFEDRTWVFLPGVPAEMKSLMTQDILPYFQKTFLLKSEIASEMMNFIGIGESTLEEELYDLIHHQTNPTLAPLASEGEVSLRITATGETDEKAYAEIEQIKQKVIERVGSFYYGSDDRTIEETVLHLLKKKKLTIGAAESLTGGLFIESLIALPGASAVCQGSLVAYTAKAKAQMIQVPEELIEEFGTISPECARTMAFNSRRLLETDISISFTGVAGPDSSEGHEPGSVFIGIVIGEEPPEVHHVHLIGNRSKVRKRAVKKGYELLYHLLKN